MKSVAIPLTSQRSFNIREAVWLLIIAAYSMNFINYGVYLPLMLMPILFVYFVKNKISGTALLLIAFCGIYTITQYVYGYATMGNALLYLVYPIACYTAGRAMVKDDSTYTKTFRLLMVLIGSFTLFGFLSLSKTISMYGSFDTDLIVAIGGRKVISYWGNNAISATGLNTYLSFGLSLFLVSFLPNKARLIKLFCFGCFILSAYCMITLGNRTGVIILLASIVTVYLFSAKMSAKKLFALVYLILGAISLKMLYDVDFLGAKTAFEGTVLYSRFDQTSVVDDPRYEAWKAAFSGIFQNPMGGKETYLPLGHAHNLWLDVGYSAGILPFLVLIIITIISIKSLRTLINSDAPTLLKGIFIALYTSFLITFFVEPIMEGWFTYFTIFCLVTGMMQQINTNHKK